MIFGIGTDILQVSRVKNENSLARRILTQNEYTDFESSKKKKNFIAKRFSVKEAVAKALGVGIGKMLSFQDISIIKNTKGKPLCYVKEDVLVAICNTNNAVVHVSIADTEDTVQTFALVELHNPNSIDI